MGVLLLDVEVGGDGDVPLCLAALWWPHGLATDPQVEEGRRVDGRARGIGGGHRRAYGSSPGPAAQWLGHSQGQCAAMVCGALTSDWNGTDACS
jgi:hypothetical protein